MTTARCEKRHRDDTIRYHSPQTHQQGYRLRGKWGNRKVRNVGRKAKIGYSKEMGTVEDRRVEETRGKGERRKKRRKGMMQKNTE